MASIDADHNRPDPTRGAQAQIELDLAWLRGRSNFEEYSARLERRAAKKGLLIFAASAATTALILVLAMTLVYPG